MKKDLKFYTDLPLFIFTTCIIWALAFGINFVLVLDVDLTNFYWWLIIFLSYGNAIALPIIIYPRTMAKIHLNETGIKKTVFRKNKWEFIKWEDILDVQVLTRPNGYSYIIVSSEQIKCESFEEVLRTKKIIYFSYHNEAFEFINDKLKNKIC